MRSTRCEPAALLVMGVAGSGKTTIGRRLARRLGWSFIEADDAHPAANIAKMRAGIPLDDEDREPWLDAVRARIEDRAAAGENVVIACSALRRDYRARLLERLPCTGIVHLEGSRELLERRLRTRRGHYMPAELLDSQLATLEPPVPLTGDESLNLGTWADFAITLDPARPPAALVGEVIRRLVA